MANLVKTFTSRLDGEQSLSIPIELKKYGRYLTTPVDIIVRGYLKFPKGPSSEVVERSFYESSEYQKGSSNLLDDQTIIYSVLFVDRRLTINNGRGVVTLVPRSEDILQDIEEVQTRSESEWIDDNIITNNNFTSIPDEQIIEEDKDNQTKIIIETGEIREPYKISIEIYIVDNYYYGETVDVPYNANVEIPKESTTGNTTGAHYNKEISKNALVSYFNNKDWLPEVKDILKTNSSSFETIMNEIEDIRYSTPFGVSPLSDALFSAAEILSDNEVDEIKKLIYLFTDNDTNTSMYSVDEAIESVNNIDAYKRVPVLCGNLSIIDPIALSVKANSTDTSSLNKISFLTGGQSLTLVTEENITDIITIFYGQSVGALAYGVFQFTVDLEEIVSLSSILSQFSISSEIANANWSISISSDGYNFVEINKLYTYNEEAEFQETYARYIKFNIIFITGFDRDEYIMEAISPFLRNIVITYNEIKKAYLYLNTEDVPEVSPYQISLAVNGSDIDSDQIEAGVATSISHNWDDYSTDSKPHVDQNGKIVVPIRYSSPTGDFEIEPLEKINNFTLKALHGQWDPYSSFIVYGENNIIISENEYKVFPREGIVVFNSLLDDDYQKGDYKINITNQNKYRIGLKLENKSVDTPLEIYGIGNLYTTGKDLFPPASKILPEAREILIFPDNPEMYTPIELSYTFYSINHDEENTLETKIRWYINGNHISFLDNLRKWNDVEDLNDVLYSQAFSFKFEDLSEGENAIDKARDNSEFILNVGDRVYCTVQVSDGQDFGEVVKSNILNVIEVKPFVSEVSVKGMKSDGSIIDNLSADITAVIYPDLGSSFYSDTNINNSEIVWLVNGEEFKRGIFGHVSDEGHRIDRIIPSESSPSTGQVGLVMFNEIVVQIIPKSGLTEGDKISSAVIVVQNSLPTVSNAKILPLFPNENQNLVLTWDFFDFEINVLVDASQSDETTVKWFRKNISSGVFEEFAELTNESIPSGMSMEKTSLGVGTVMLDASFTSVEDQWYAIIYPNDSLDAGEEVQTETVIIRSVSN